GAASPRSRRPPSCLIGAGSSIQARSASRGTATHVLPGCCLTPAPDGHPSGEWSIRSSKRKPRWPRPTCRPRSPSVSRTGSELPRAALLLGLVPALVAAGCGSSEPHLARTDVAPLIALANRVAVEAPCAQKRDLAALDRR